MDELIRKEAEIMLDVEMLPAEYDGQSFKGYKKLSMSDLASGGAIFSSIFEITRSSASGGLYRVTFPEGVSGTLGVLKDGIEDFEDEYLQDVVGRIEEMSEQQQLFYGYCRDELEKYARSTAESFVTGIGSGVVKGVGEVLSCIPLVNNTGADEALKNAGKEMDNSIDEKINKKFSEIDEFRVGTTDDYVEDIRSLGKLYSDPLTIVFDENNVYVGVDGEVA